MFENVADQVDVTLNLISVAMQTGDVNVGAHEEYHKETNYGCCMSMRDA